MINFFKTVGEILIEYWPYFLKGVFSTIVISFVSTIIGLVIGLIVGIIRTIPKSKKKPIRIIQKIVDIILAIYIEVFRGTPMMVQSMVIYWGYAFATGGEELNLWFAAIFIVSINTGAYIAEIVRGGINGIDKGQFEGAHSLGMTHFQTMTLVIIPQVMKSILPSISNEFVINIKDTSVLNVISVTELFFFVKLTAKETFKIFQTYFIASVIYLILTVTITRIIKLIEKKLAGKKDFVLADENTQIKEQGVI